MNKYLSATEQKNFQIVCDSVSSRFCSISTWLCKDSSKYQHL